jgi:hypothetical protein
MRSRISNPAKTRSRAHSVAMPAHHQHVEAVLRRVSAHHLTCVFPVREHDLDAHPDSAGRLRSAPELVEAGLCQPAQFAALTVWVPIALIGRRVPEHRQGNHMTAIAPGYRSSSPERLARIRRAVEADKHPAERGGHQPIRPVAALVIS